MMARFATLTLIAIALAGCGDSTSDQPADTGASPGAAAESSSPTTSPAYAAGHDDCAAASPSDLAAQYGGQVGDATSLAHAYADAAGGGDPLAAEGCTAGLIDAGHADGR